MQELTSTTLGQLALLAAGYGALVTLAGLAVTVARIERPAVLVQGVWILQALLVLRVVAGIAGLLRGQQAAEPAAHLGYLVSAVCVLPIAMQAVREDRGPWSNAVITVAALAVTVIAVRLQMTWA